jgi:hypothetical protein
MHAQGQAAWSSDAAATRHAGVQQASAKPGAGYVPARHATNSRLQNMARVLILLLLLLLLLLCCRLVARCLVAS